MRCRWHLACLALEKRSHLQYRNKVTRMPKTASFRLAPSATLFAHVMATVDRLLMASASIAIRNGDLPYFGL